MQSFRKILIDCFINDNFFLVLFAFRALGEYLGKEGLYKLINMERRRTKEGTRERNRFEFCR